MLAGTALSCVLFHMVGVATAERCSPRHEGECDADSEFYLSSSDDDMAALSVRSSVHSRRAPESKPPGCFTSLSPDFPALVKGSECPRTLANKSFQFAHEGPVYLESQNSVIFSSNRLGDNENMELLPDSAQFVMISKVDLATGVVTVLPEEVWNQSIIMANGAFPDPQNPDAVLWCAQGDMSRPSGVIRLNTVNFTVETVIDASPVSEYDGTSFTMDPTAQFNSPNDIVVDARSGAILFTDPIYGFFQDFRPEPQLGNEVWIKRAGDDLPNISFEAVAAKVAEDFSRPNGIAFDNNYSRVYITDTGFFPGAKTLTTIGVQAFKDTEDHGDLFKASDPLLPRSIYTFDVIRDENEEIVKLSNREFFASSLQGIPDGIKVDCEGRVYTGVAGGVDVYSRDGILLGKILADSGVSNFVLVPRGKQTELVMLAETEIQTVMLNTATCKP